MNVMNVIHKLLYTWLAINFVMMIGVFALAVARQSQAEILAPIFLISAFAWIGTVLILGGIVWVKRKFYD